MATQEDAAARELAQRLLDQRLEDLGMAERRVLGQIARGETTSRNPHEVAAEEMTFGDRLADKVAAVGGSWAFIIGFALVLFGWMILNTDILEHFGLVFDPYPFIFLNLMLSTLAAIQAPIIMMSQNRQAKKDRLAARLDYETNLRAELDILRLHEKVDQLIVARLEAIEGRVDALAATPPASKVEKRPKPD